MDSRPPRAGWIRLGRLLPREIRERIFEPAYADLLRRWLDERDQRRGWFGLRVLATYAGCLPIAAPRLFVRRGRLTVFARVTILATGTLVVGFVALRNLVDY